MCISNLSQHHTHRNLYSHEDFCHSSVNFCAHSRTYPRSLPLTPAPIRAHSRTYPRSLSLTHSHSLPHMLMHEYLQEHDESPNELSSREEIILRSSQASSVTL